MVTFLFSDSQKCFLITAKDLQQNHKTNGLDLQKNQEASASDAQNNQGANGWALQSTQIKAWESQKSKNVSGFNKTKVTRVWCNYLILIHLFSRLFSFVSFLDLDIVLNAILTVSVPLFLHTTPIYQIAMFVYSM